MESAIGIIPARHASQRFPGKPLALILGRPMIQWVYERACSSNLLSRIIIATDDDRILQAARSFGADVRMTSSRHTSGTERVAEAVSDLDASIIINIQGDEPLIRGEMLDSLVSSLRESESPMATLAARSEDPALFQDENVVKVVVDRNGYALYFSRSPIPAGFSGYFWRHIGLYGYRRNFLLRFSSLSASPLERQERLEQLRALEHGHRIKIIESRFDSLSVDTPKDIIKVENYLKQEKSNG